MRRIQDSTSTRTANESCASNALGREMALTKVELLVVIAIAGFLVFWAMSGMSNGATRSKAKRIKCVNNLKEIGLAFRKFPGSGNYYPGPLLMGEGVAMGSIDVVMIFRALTNEVTEPRIFVCPSDKAKRAAEAITNLTARNISYFASLTADEHLPQVILGGDRNLATNGMAVGSGLIGLRENAVEWSWTKEVHNEQGNVLMGDGSVQQMSSSRLRQAVKEQEVGTNWVVIP